MRACTPLSAAILLGLSGACSDPAMAVPLPRLHPQSWWNQPVTGALVHPQSSAMISRLNSLGGFGNNRLQIDFSFHVVHAAAGVPTIGTVQIPGGNPDDAYYAGDCEALGTPVPLPAGAAIEGSSNMSCNNLGGDCHYLVWQPPQLFEVYRGNSVGGSLETQCVAIWRGDGLYPATNRGDHCTSADAAGFPIAPLLFNADEVAAAVAAGSDSDLGHAIRFILPNPRMARDTALGGVSGRLYVRPGTHAGAPTGPVDTVPYGARLRLKDFDMTGYAEPARVLLRTMQRYGIVLADGGTVALTAESDRYTTATWASLGLEEREFDQTVGATKVLITHFDVLDTGPRIAETYDCVRTGPSFGNLFQNGFE